MISKILTLETIDSTNEFLHYLLNSGECQDGTLVVAKEQTAGKGLAENKWESEPGKNLTLSIFHVPFYISPADQFLLNITVALAVREFVAALVPTRNVTVKWPNDVYIDDGKVAGILIQNAVTGIHFTHSIIGIGININQIRFRSSAPNPVSVIHYLQKELDLEESLNLLTAIIDLKFNMLQSGQHEKLREEYLWNLYRLGKLHGYRINGILQVARITGITNFGQLMLRNEDETDYVCDLKEVEFLI